MSHETLGLSYGPEGDIFAVAGGQVTGQVEKREAAGGCKESCVAEQELGSLDGAKA